MVIYSTGQVASFDDIVNAMHAAAQSAGWTSSVADTADGGNANDVGRTLELSWGEEYEVTVRSAVNISTLQLPEPGGVGANLGAPGMFCLMAHVGGSTLTWAFTSG